MADSFDPYHKWLGISPKDQPPNHYRLLAIELFETDPDVIEGAADRQMAHVRTFQTGQNSALSQRILNELSAARLCLLNPQKKTDYDRRLREKIAAGHVEGVSIHSLPKAKPLPVTDVPLIVADSPSSSSSTRTQKRGRKAPLWQQPLAVSAVGAVVLLACAVYFLTVRGKEPSQAVGKNTSADPVTAPKTTGDNAPAKKTVDRAPKITKQLPSVATSASGEPDFAITEATWGAGDKWVNVTDGVRGLVKDNRLLFMAWSNLFGSPEDPAPGVAKALRIQYQSRGRVYSAVYPENFFVYLDGNPLAPPTDSPGDLQLLEARYGAGKTYIDVLPQLREHVHQGRVAVSADQFAAATADELAKQGMNEGQVINEGTFKVLWVRYRNATGEHFMHVWNADRLVIDSRPPATAGATIDLMKLIDPDRDAVSGKWKFDGSVLITPAEPGARLEIPFEPPEEYELRIVCEGDHETRDIGAGLVVGGRQVLAAVDGLSGTASGLSLVDGAWGNNNPSCHWRCGPMLEQGRPNTLVFVIRRTSVAVYRDGAELIHWSGHPASLSIISDWSVHDAQHLFLKSHDTSLRITKLELVPLVPEKSPMLVASESGSPVDALKAIELDRDRLHGNWQYNGQTLVSPSSEKGQIQLPVVVPANYRLHVVVQRESGSDALSFTLPIAGAQVSFLIDAGNGTRTGLRQIDGKNIDSNETKHETSIFADGKEKLITITVRGNHVQAECGGEQLVDWKGDVSRLRPTEVAPYKDRVYLGSHLSRYRLTKIELTPLGPDAGQEPPPSLAKGPVDLLKHIDPKRDAITGDWSIADGVLQSPAAEFACLAAPPPPAPEYRLTVRLERLQGIDTFSVGLPIGKQQVIAAVDAWDGKFSGLEKIDGKSCYENETAHEGRALEAGRRHTLVYAVRANGVKVDVDGQTVIDWSGDPARLSTIPVFTSPDPRQLVLGTAHHSVFRISRLEIEPLDPKKPTAGLLKIFEDEPGFVEALKLADLGAQAVLVSDEAYSGRASVKVTPSQRYSEALPGLDVKIRKRPTAPDEYRYLRFAWKKRGGQQIWLQLHHPGNWFRYRAGPNQDEGWAGVRVADELPNDFVVVTRDLAADFGEFTLNGIALTPFDGQWACFDHIYLARSLSDFDSIETPPTKPPARKFSDLASGKSPRVPVSDEAAQKQAKQALLKKLAAAKSAEQKRKLAQQFVEEASLAGSPDANVYVLLSQAVDLAEACGDLDLAWQAIDQLASTFAINADELRQKSLTEIAKTAKSPERCRELVDSSCRLLVSALVAGEAEIVKKTAAQAQSLAKRTKDKTLQKDLNGRAAGANRLAGELEAVAAARETLKSIPDDAHANFVVGHWQLCVEDDWEPALVKLAKGDDESWKKLAAESRPLVHDISDPNLQITTADAWWEAVEKEPWPGRHYLRLHAANWYRLALPSLMGEKRNHADQRLKLVLATDEGLPAWELFNFSGGQSVGGFKRITRGGAMRTHVDYDGPMDVTFVARTDSLNIRLVAYDRDVVIWNWELNPSELRVERPNGGTVPVPVKPLEPNRWYEFHYRITRQGTTIMVDGVPVFTENRAYSKFPRGPVGVTGAGNAVVDVKKFVVRAVD